MITRKIYNFCLPGIVLFTVTGLVSCDRLQDNNVNVSSTTVTGSAMYNNNNK